MEIYQFRSLVVTEQEDNTFIQNVEQREIWDLPEGDVLINVKYSSLNYKDALSSFGNRGVTRNYPHTPGIDASGVVIESKDHNFKVGDNVIVTGNDLGMNTSGGFSEYIRVPGSWVVKMPKGLSLKESMVYGTAGLTAALSVEKLINSGVRPENGDILVTGATGGVGSMAVSILNKLGYSVVAGTGKTNESEMLKAMGAKEIIHRKNIDDKSGKPMLKSKWAGVVDTVGGNILSTSIKATKYGGTVTCCGNVADHEFYASVYPFILKGITLCGIDSVKVPTEVKNDIWEKLSSEWNVLDLYRNIEIVSLMDLSSSIKNMLAGKHKGRTIVDLSLID